ncbi:16S rRNA (guanine(966)-N(2))-methyltransferase RsmD [Mycoplasmopsis ciconiae]|uniref:16S rRNA (Guanine(966)-N(2))-methyltransferase RsmD n=1 Tax=Mycoplasmopsis ciconiae TaxID=561067 RepID=A0ABU7MLG9_9BACT|nr:16S rRNA (guanine(966)-N(2))-methyltransferase RsmD [Mycoplasmopsis ciconiae]
MLRIIAGKYRSLLLDQPRKDNTRATTDKVREAIFSSIQFELDDALILDLFAGSGAWCFEALSRGAMKAIAVDIDEEAYEVISNNAQKLKCHNIEIYRESAQMFLEKNKGKTFDFIFMDAPYLNVEQINECLKLIEQNKFLKNLGKIIIETNAPEKIIFPSNLMVQKSKVYGITTILFVSHIDI